MMQLKGNGHDELPASWITATIGDLLGAEGVFSDGDWVESKDQDPAGGVRLIQLADIGDGHFVDASDRFLTEQKAKELRCTFLLRGDILVARMPDPLGRACIFPLPGDRRFVTVVDVCIVRPGSELVDRKFLAYALNSPRVRVAIDNYKSGSTRKRISRKNLGRVRIPIAPANEQRRIVAKIEELLSELDKGVESLQTARAQLDVYRQALLKYAFEGKLTADWRDDNQDALELPDKLIERAKEARAAGHREQLDSWNRAVKQWESDGKPGRKPSKPRSPKSLSPLGDAIRRDVPSVPESWTWGRLGWMTCGVEYGTSAKSDEAGRVPVIRMGNLQNGKLDWSDLVYSSDEEEIERYRLRDGDVLFNRTNSPELVGKSAIYRGGREAIFAGYLIRVNQIPAVVDSQYLNLFLNSYVARRHGNRVKTDGVNQSNINGTKLMHYPFPYCSLAEQREIVRRLEQKLSIVDQLSADLRHALEQAGGLRHSILKRGFAGELVDQNSSDEPASVLVKRIQAEREIHNSRSNKKRKVAS